MRDLKRRVSDLEELANPDAITLISVYEDETQEEATRHYLAQHMLSALPKGLTIFLKRFTDRTDPRGPLLGAS